MEDLVAFSECRGSLKLQRTDTFMPEKTKIYRIFKKSLKNLIFACLKSGPFSVAFTASCESENTARFSIVFCIFGVKESIEIPQQAEFGIDLKLNFPIFAFFRVDV